MNTKEISKLRELLKNYEQENGNIDLKKSDALNCYCGAVCTNSCSTYCDGAGAGGRNICWQLGRR